MKITFIIGFPNITGGHRAIFEIANGLIKRRHKVNIVYPHKSIYSRRNNLLRENVWLEKLLGPFYQRLFVFNDSGQNWFALNAKVEEVPFLEEKYIPDGDIIIATAWKTAEYVNKISYNKGKKVYFIQHYETWSGPKSKVDATWKMPFKKIVTAPWLRKLGEEKFGDKDIEIVTYGVNFDMFNPPISKTVNDPIRVGMLYHRSEWKGYKDGIKVIENIRQRNYKIDLILFGLFPRNRKEVPSYVQYYEKPSPEKLRDIYRNLDIFLCPSKTETGPLTVLESMASKVAVVSTNIGSVPIWTQQGKFALLSPSGDVNSLTENLIKLLNNKQLIVQYAEGGYKYAQNFTWDRTVGKFEEILLELL